MGNKTSATVIQTSITNIITSTIVNSLQSESSVLNVSQNVVIDCTETRKNIMDEYSRCIDKYKSQCNSTSNQLSDCDASALRLCEALSPANLVCSGENISLKNTINVNITTDQISNISSQLENKLKESLKSIVDQTNTGLIGSNVNSDTKITSVVNAVMQTVLNVAIESMQKSDFSQDVNIRDGNGKFITLENTTDIIKKTVQNSSAVTTAISDLSKTMESSITQVGGFDIWTIVILISIILGVFIILLVFWYIFSKKKDKNNSKSNNDINLIVSSAKG